MPGELLPFKKGAFHLALQTRAPIIPVAIKNTDWMMGKRTGVAYPGTIEIVNIVAAAGFGMTLTVEDLLVADPGDLHEEVRDPEVGMAVTLHTVDGYKRVIIVGVEDEEVICVLLDGIKLGSDRTYLDPVTASVQDYADIHPHDLVVVKPHQLLHARYSSLGPTHSDTLH